MSFNKIEEISKSNNYEFININSTLSTMIDAKKYLEKNNSNCIILANEQIAGKGRRGNHWHSPKGNIYSSITFNNCLKKNEFFLFNIIIALSIKLALKEFKARNIYFKWPNDIFYKNKKFCGIIAETYQTKHTKNFIISGIGINMISSPTIKEHKTTYVRSFCKIINITDFMELFLEILFLNLNYLLLRKKKYLIDQFSDSLMFLGEEISLKLDDKSIISGFFLGINPDGSLILKNNKKVENIYNGSIIL